MESFGPQGNFEPESEIYLEISNQTDDFLENFISGLSEFGTMIKFESEPDVFGFITEGILLTVISIFGLVGNVMSTVVLVKSSCFVRPGRTSFSNLLRGLSIIDSLFLFMALAHFGLPKFSTTYLDMYQTILPTAFGFLNTFRVASVYVTMSITLERFHAIVYPLSEFKWHKFLLPLACSAACLLNVPKFFELKIVNNSYKNDSYIFNTELRNNSIFSLYLFWSKFIFVEVIPYLFIAILNIIIINKIRKSTLFRLQFQTSSEKRTVRNKMEDNTLNGVTCRNNEDTSSCSRTSVHNRTSGRRDQQEEHNLGKILAAMSSIFIICQSFKIVPDFYDVIVCKDIRSTGKMCVVAHEPTINVITQLSHFFVCLNSSVNFLIYYLNGEKFRKAWTEIYGIWPCVGKNSDNQSGMKGHLRGDSQIQHRLVEFDGGSKKCPLAEMEDLDESEKVEP